jgi:hypothetical protein
MTFNDIATILFNSIQKGVETMNFIVFMLLFTVLCGWLDSQIGPPSASAGREAK